MRAPSYIAPKPEDSLNTPEECPGLPVTVSIQPEAARRPMVAVSLPCLSFTIPSKPSARSLLLAALTSSARVTSKGEPGFSSAPVNTMVMLVLSSACNLASARNASTMITSPPFMSDTPGPRMRSPLRSQRWTGLSFSNTVSRWPIKRSRLPCLPSRAATRWPARCMAGGKSTQRVVKPRWSNSARNMRPTSRTPSGFKVPLLTFTVRSRNCKAAPERSFTAATICCSAAVSAAAASAASNARRAASTARCPRCTFMSPPVFPSKELGDEIAVERRLKRSPPLRLELPHVLDQPLHPLDRHGVVDRRSHAADGAVAFELHHAARFRPFQEFAVELGVRECERDIHARAVRLAHVVLEEGAGVEEVVEELRLGDVFLF